MASAADKAIVESVLAGDKPAFGVLIDRHRAGALGFARRMVGPTDAEDIVQEAFLAGFLSLGKLRDGERFGSWLLGIVANFSRTRLRRNREGRFDDWFGGQRLEDLAPGELEPSPEAVYQARELHRLISEAIAALPSAQRQAVRLHYVDGLRISEIAALTASPAGTIKARLHHARERMRKSLMDELEIADVDRIEGEPAMIEVTVYDVAVRAPVDAEAKWLAQGKDYKLGLMRVVLLKERDGERMLPIWIGPVEGDIIAMILEGLETTRPMTWNLTTALLKAGGLKIEKVAVTALRDNVYLGSIWLNVNGERREVDARPSDAITLALHANAPILVNEELFENWTTLLPGDVLGKLENISATGGKVQEPDGKEWKSYRSLPRAENPGIIATAASKQTQGTPT
ncbi:MAG: bifunctional nuclease domain-containing protein [Candidatus Binataceae bacterium]